MNPLQIAALTTSLAPVAARSLEHVVDAVTGQGSEFLRRLRSQQTEATNEESNASEVGLATTGFQSLYKKLQASLEQLLGSVSQSDAAQWQVEIQTGGKISLRETSGVVGSQQRQAIEDWLNQNEDLGSVAHQTLAAKQKQDWQQGLATSSSSSLNFRILASGKTDNA